jgi:hypothetical protein
VNCGPGHIQWNDNTAYSGFNIQLNVSKLLLKISREFNEGYTANLLPNTAHIIQFTLCETVVPTIYHVITAPHIQASIFNWIYLRCYWRYLDNSMSVIPQSWCQIQSTFPGLRYVKCGSGHIQCNYSYVYSGFNIQVNQYALLLEISRYFDARYNANLVAFIAHILQFTLLELCSRDVQCNNSSAYSCFNIHLNLPALL